MVGFAVTPQESVFSGGGICLWLVFKVANR